ncbi:hypothetical protein T11_11972, partial [Trichinella zimbabwensis]
LKLINLIILWDNFTLSKYPKPRLTEWGPTGNRIPLAFFVLLRVVRDLLRVVRDLLRAVRDLLRAVRVLLRVVRSSLFLFFIVHLCKNVKC